MYVLNANHISKSYKTAETMRILQNVNLQVGNCETQICNMRAVIHNQWR